MRYGHEVGQSWPTKYGVVGGVEVGDVEVDVLDTKVASRAELYREGDLSKQLGCPTSYHNPEGGVRGSEVFYSKAQLLQGFSKKEVQSASVVDEYFP